MEVLPFSGVQSVEESDCPQQSPGAARMCHENGEQVTLADGRLDDPSLKIESPQTEKEGEVGTLSTHFACQCSGASSCDCQAEGPKSSYDAHDFEDEDTNEQNYDTEPCSGTENLHSIVDTIESESPNNNREGEQTLTEPSWLKGDESVALWVKWRGKWQAGIRCSRADWPLSTLKAKPTHDRKKYFVIFFPHTRNYSWADMLLVRSINDFPQPIAYKTHKAGLKMVKDLTVARRFIMQKLAVGMLSIVDQFHADALVENARDVSAWKEFAVEASCCNGYSDLGRMLVKLQNMILQCYVNADWLQNSFSPWIERCKDANSAESIELLKEELFDSILWGEVNSLSATPIQPTLGSEWKTWKHDITKWFSMSPTSNNKNMQQQCSDDSLSARLQICRKRPKLEVRRAEAPGLLVETKDSDHAITLETDPGFFNKQETVNIFASETCRQVAVPIESPSGVANKWNDIVIEAGGSELSHTKNMGVQMDEAVAAKSVEPGSKNRQCIAFIEAKGRQCVRWANDGDVYCCVHLSARFLGRSARAERPTFVDTPMCEGTTVLGTRCKHRALHGSSFCKKHRPHTETEQILNHPQTKTKHEESNAGPLSTSCKDIVLVGDVESPIRVDPVSVMDCDSFHRRTNLMEKPEQSDNNNTGLESVHCIGSPPDDDHVCIETAKFHSLYCEKHLPSWLKRARNGKSRIISKEVFKDLLRECCSHEQKVYLHKACELFYRLFKSILSLRNPVPKDIQFEWALSEASKDNNIGEIFIKLVQREKERIRIIWGFEEDITAGVPLLMEGPAQFSSAVVCYDDGNIVKCKICSEEFLNDQALGDHWMDNHKKEAQWLFRGHACAICLDSFTNRKGLEIHVQERHHVQFVEQCMLLQCIPCGSHFGNTEQLWSHVLSVHCAEFRQSKASQQQNLSTGEDSVKFGPGNPGLVENNSENSGGLRKFICKFCGLKFDLLPDLGRHHQAAHMISNLASSHLPKRGIRYYAYKLKSGRLSRPRFKKGFAASYRIRSRGAGIKRRMQAAKSLSSAVISLNPQVSETTNIGRMADSQCAAVAKILFSEIQKTNPRPNNFDILAIARSTCCKFRLRASLEEKFGVLPERLYLKAAKLCSEHGIRVQWHQEGFICPNECKTLNDQQWLLPLTTVPHGTVWEKHAYIFDHMNDEWEVDECHYVINAHHIRPSSSQNAIILCEDISFGQESIPVVCVADEDVLNSLDSNLDGSEGEDTKFSMPWESFTYIIKPMLDQSMSLDAESLQFGCSCLYSSCSPEICDHVYLFDNDYDDAKDIYGKPMRGRFPYDKNGRIILEEGYLVYECSHMCSCSRNCPNRVLQNGVQVKLEVFKTEKKGWAVRAGEAILRGTFVCEYIGEVLDEQEANERRKRHGKDDCTYFYNIDAHNNDMSRLIEGEVRYVIDATTYGNVSRFINHSCSPNLVNHQVLVESMDCLQTHIGLYASQDIALGEELTYNYRYKLLPGEGYPCHCGSSNCRGRLH